MTITTVGFGDITAVTPLGRVVASVLMVGGMFTLALFAGIRESELDKVRLSSVVSLGGTNVYSGSVPARFELPVPFGRLVEEEKRADGVLVIGVRRGSHDLVNPPDDFLVMGTDVLVYLAEQPLPADVGESK